MCLSVGVCVGGAFCWCRTAVVLPSPLPGSAETWSIYKSKTQLWINTAISISLAHHSMKRSLSFLFRVSCPQLPVLNVLHTHTAPCVCKQMCFKAIFFWKPLTPEQSKRITLPKFSVKCEDYPLLPNAPYQDPSSLLVSHARCDHWALIIGS